MEEKSRFIQKSWRGPWLLDGEAIRELDKIISDHWEKIEQRRILLLEKDVKAAYKSYKNIYKSTPLPSEIRENLSIFRRDSQFALADKSIEILLSKDNIKSHSCDSFDSAFRELSLIEAIPLGFAVHLTSGDINCRIFVDDSTKELEIIVSPKDVVEARELFATLYSWADKHSQSAVQKFFESLSRRRWYFVVPYTAALLLLFIQAQNQSIENLREKAIGLLKTGITQSNVTEAVDILLRIETQSVTPQPIQFPSWFWLSLVGLLYLILVLFLQPRVILGIGNGSKKIKQWKWWQGTLLITIPLFIVGLLSTFFGERILQSIFP